MRPLAVSVAAGFLLAGALAGCGSSDAGSGATDPSDARSTTTDVPATTVTSSTDTEPPRVTASTTNTSTPATSAGAPDSTGPLVESAGDVFVTASSDRRALIDVRDAVGIVASFDLTCPSERDCVVRSAHVMGDTIWVAITDVEPGAPDTVVRSRVASVSLSTGDVVAHLSIDGPAAVRSAGRGADGVIYAQVDGQTGELVAVEGGELRVVSTGVSAFRLSDDGRFLAVSFSNPPAGEPARFEIKDLVDQTTADFQTDDVNAGPAAWSPDGRYLIVDENWEDGTAWVVDPWSGSGEPIPGTEGFLDGACFMSDGVVAHRTWNVGYGQGDAQPGVIRLTSLDTGTTIAEIGDNLFGDGLRCHADGSISYLRRPVIEVERSTDFTQLEPDYEAPVELIHIAPDGTTSTRASGDLRLV